METRFKRGDFIKSTCGDRGIVVEVGLRPDENVPGFYAYWFQEAMCFWMSDDEPQISLITEKRSVDKSSQN